MKRPLRIFYAAGPGDVIGTFGYWKAGHDDPSQVSLTYSGQFLDACRDLGAEGYVLSYHADKKKITDDGFVIEHRPIPKWRGPLFHLAYFWSGLRMTWTAWRWGADVAIISAGAHWFSLALMPRLGIKTVPALLCTLWLKHRPPTGLKKIIQKLDARFFRKRTAATLSMSADCTDQLNQCTGGYAKPVVPFLPTYRRESFAAISAPPPLPPFRVMSAGRIETNKGVFDLLAIAERFARQGRTDIEFDLCGTGSQLVKLRQQAEEAGVASRFRCHGHLDRAAMAKMFSQCHVLIAPTTSDFIEGFNQTVAEGVLAGRPVITSDACPALQYVRDAVVDVPVDDVLAYGEAILKLADDPTLYAAKRAGCANLAEAFYDLEKGWRSAVKRAVLIACPPDSSPSPNN
jgi:glycosyltransferase involved in cell wall biosynthesis